LVVADGEQRWAAAQQVVVAPDAGQVVGRQAGFLRGPRGARP
ncbi:MAG: folate-binding protein, partial [Actinomycetota bacterium]